MKLALYKNGDYAAAILHKTLPAQAWPQLKKRHKNPGHAGRISAAPDATTDAPQRAVAVRRVAARYVFKGIFYKHYQRNSTNHNDDDATTTKTYDGDYDGD
jgi:hypothetical protein